MKKLLVFAMALALLMCMSSWAMAEVKVGADLRLEVAWATYDDDWDNVDEYFALAEFGNHTSRFKITYLSDDKKFYGYYEIGAYSRDDGNAVSTRRYELTYRWDGGEFMMGQDYDIGDLWWPAQNLRDSQSMIGYGKHYLPRNEMARLTLGKQYKFMFMIGDPFRGSVWDGGHTYHTLPLMGIAADLHFGNVRLNPWINYENTQWEDGNDSDDYDSWDMGLQIRGDFGLIGFTVSGSYGVNTKQSTPVVTSNPLVINNEVDEYVYQWNLWAELRIGGLALGYGHVRSSRDDWDDDPWRQGAYASYVIPFGPMSFTPEIVWFDNGEDQNEVEQGEAFYFGVLARMVF